MYLSKIDAENLSNAIKTARKKQHLTQERCAEVLNLSAPYQKDLERMRSIPSVPVLFHLCRLLDMSADSVIFYGSQQDSSPYQVLLRLASQCRDSELEVLISTAKALLNTYGNKYSPKETPNSDKLRSYNLFISHFKTQKTTCSYALKCF